MSPVACPDLQHFSTVSDKRHDFIKKTLLTIKCSFRDFLQLLSEILLILRRNEQDMIETVYWSSP